MELKKLRCPNCRKIIGEIDEIYLCIQCRDKRCRKIRIPLTKELIQDLIDGNCFDCCVIE